MTHNMASQWQIWQAFHFFIQSGLRVSPGLSVTSQQVDKRLDLSGRDVFFQQLAVVVQQRGDRVLSQDLVTDLRLHDRELFGYIFLRE